MEALVELDGARNVESVGEHQTLGHRVDVELAVVGDGLLGPLDRITRVMAQAIEELGEVEIEVGQEGVHPDHVGQRNAQIAAVFLHPAFQGGFLEVAQAEAEGLVGLQILVRHGADRREAEALGEEDVGGAAEVFRHFRGQRPHDGLVPRPRIAAAQTEVEEHERILLRGQGIAIAFEEFDLLLQPRPGNCKHRLVGRQPTEIELVDDVEDEDLEGHDVHQRAFRHDAQLIAIGTHFDETPLEAEHRKKVDEVALDEAQAAQIGEFVPGEAQRAQAIELGLDIGAQLRQRVGRRVATDEGVLGMRARVAVQQRLPHREFVEVVLQQAADDGCIAVGAHFSTFQAALSSVGVGHQFRQDIGRRRDLHAAAAHVLYEGGVLGLESGHCAHAIGQQHQPAERAGSEGLDDVLGRRLDAVAPRFAGNQHAVGLLQALEEFAVDLGAGVVGIRHFGLDGAVVLGPGVGALDDLGDDTHRGFFPTVVGAPHVLMHVVAPGADFAVHRPDHVGVASIGFEGIQVSQHLPQTLPPARQVAAYTYVRRQDLGERRDGRTIALTPEGRMGDVDALV